LEDVAAERSTSSAELSAEEIIQLRRQLTVFYRDVAPNKLQKIDGIVEDFVSRGATRCELQYLDDELRTVYGRDLASVSFPADRTSRHPYTDLEDSEEDPGLLQSSTANRRPWQAVSAALAAPEGEQVAQGDIRYSSGESVSQARGPIRKSVVPPSPPPPPPP
jgi:hypothetical protein